MSRRRFLSWAAAAGGAVMLGEPLAARARAASPADDAVHPACAGRLNDIDHIVIVIEENRSFDHYFGTYPGVRGFSDRHGRAAFSQTFPANTSVAPVGKILPYHLDTSMTGKGECTPDPTHSWAPQHRSWNGGAMDGWGAAHQGEDWSFMGYYTRSDLPYYYAVADTFTICDRYHCSVMGSTTSNRLYSVSAWLDPHGDAGGPVLSTITWDPTKPKLSWTTYPERLTAAGVSWASYASPDADTQENPLVDFKQFYPGNTGYRTDYTEAVFGHTYADFLADAAAGHLPQVSWVMTSIADDEHPSGPPRAGEFALQQIIDALTANPTSWAKTALFWTYDENGGYFDHVAPPTAPAGTYGEWITAPSPPNPAGPIGLGFRVPMLVVSPFSRGGFVSTETFDHTSLLQFIEQRFTVEVPNLTPWRREVTGDLTSAFNFAAPDFSPPQLAPRTPWTPVEHPECVTEELTMDPSPAPAHQAMPAQEPGTRRRPSGLPEHCRT